MINLVLFVPLALGGVVSALLREHRKKQQQPVVFAPDVSITALISSKLKSSTKPKKIIVVDDVAEVSHIQRISLIALALSGSGWLVFAPITLISIPLLSYSTFYFMNTVLRANNGRKKSAFTIFEIASVVGTLITGRYLLLSSLLAFAFSTRKWGLQAGNLSHIGMNRALDPSFRRIWVMRDEVEIEINLSELQHDDIAMLQTGDVIRKNGEVMKGEGVVNQYSLAGIIQAIPKHTGDSVFAFTKVAAGDLSIKYT